ncbi:MAG: hypothetical protein C0518_00935 [Opitutus sp.]|nr:hypothetical protein [Opitutus sp.]
MSAVSSISKLTAVNACIAVVGLATSVAMAWMFGISSEIQIFFAGSSMMTILLKFFQVGQISELFVPEYVRRQELDGDAAANRFISVLLNHIMAGLAVIGAILFLLAPVFGRWIAPGFAGAQQQQVGMVFQALLPVLGLVVVSSFLQAVANARGWYGRFESFTLVGAVLGLLCLMVTARWLGLWALVLSQVVTQGLSFLQGWAFLRDKGYRHAWIWQEKGFNPRRFAGQLKATTIYVFATQWYTFAFTAALTLLPGGALAVYKYAENLYTRTSSLFLRPVSVVFFTDASVLTHRQPTKLRERLHAALYQYAMIYAVLIAGLFPAMPNLLGALWGGARYTPAEIAQTVLFAWCLFGLLLVDGTALVYRKLNIVCDGIMVQYFAMTLVQVGSALVALPLIRSFGVWGAAGMVALNMLGFWVSSAGVLWWRRKELWAFFPARTWKLVPAVVGSLAVTVLVAKWLPVLAYAGSVSLPGKIVEFGKASFLGLVGLLVAVGLAGLLGVPGLGRAEIYQRWHRLRNRVFKPS